VAAPALLVTHGIALDSLTSGDITMAAIHNEKGTRRGMRSAASAAIALREWFRPAWSEKLAAPTAS